jgi:hypothetical protein
MGDTATRRHGEAAKGGGHPFHCLAARKICASAGTLVLSMESP